MLRGRVYVSIRRENLRRGLFNRRLLVTVKRFDALDFREVDNPHTRSGRHRKGGQQNRQQPDDSSRSHLEVSISGTRGFPTCYACLE